MIRVRDYCTCRPISETCFGVRRRKFSSPYHTRDQDGRERFHRFLLVTRTHPSRTWLILVVSIIVEPLYQFKSLPASIIRPAHPSPYTSATSHTLYY